MKRFMYLFLISFAVIHFAYSFTIILKKQHNRFRRCICIKIDPRCRCNNDKQVVQERGKLQRSASATTRSQQPMAQLSQQQAVRLSACIPICLKRCMEEQYSGCQQFCHNMCKIKQSIPLPVEHVQTMLQQKQQRNMLLKIVPQYFPDQQQIWESNRDMLNKSLLVIESTHPSPSDSTGQQNIPYNQFANKNKKICIKACMPFCQCTQQRSTSITVPIFQPPMLPKSIVHQPLMSEGLPEQESEAYNNNMLYTTKKPCVSICLPTCRCLHQPGSTVSSTVSPALPHLSLAVQSEPASFETQENKQQNPATAEKISINDAWKIRQFSTCFQICEDSCMQQCIQQDGSIEQCTVSCSYACGDRCAQQSQNQQNLLKFFQSEESHRPGELSIHQQSQSKFDNIQQHLFESNTLSNNYQSRKYPVIRSPEQQQLSYSQ